MTTVRIIERMRAKPDFFYNLAEWAIPPEDWPHSATSKWVFREKKVAEKTVHPDFEVVLQTRGEETGWHDYVV